jgi:hypothetical protein
LAFYLLVPVFRQTIKRFHTSNMTRSPTSVTEKVSVSQWESFYGHVPAGPFCSPLKPCRFESFSRLSDDSDNESRLDETRVSGSPDTFTSASLQPTTLLSCKLEMTADGHYEETTKDSQFVQNDGAVVTALIRQPVEHGAYPPSSVEPVDSCKSCCGRWDTNHKVQDAMPTTVSRYCHDEASYFSSGSSNDTDGVSSCEEWSLSYAHQKNGLQTRRNSPMRCGTHEAATYLKRWQRIQSLGEPQLGVSLQTMVPPLDTASQDEVSRWKEGCLLHQSSNTLPSFSRRLGSITRDFCQGPAAAHDSQVYSSFNC